MVQSRVDPSKEWMSSPSLSYALSEDDVAIATEWASLLRSNLATLYAGDPVLDGTCLNAPRRHHADSRNAALAVEIAKLLYPTPSDSLTSPMIKYEKVVVLLRKALITQRLEQTAHATTEHEPWRKRILAQGPWDEINDRWTECAPALPMPVTISDRESLAEIFEHLSMDGNMTRNPTSDAQVFAVGKEPYYGSETLEFEKGIVYEDGRLDLCKKVVGPQNIVGLTKSLESNRFIRHFLLGNNVIGPVGARAIAEFVRRFPERMETWYLAGNCIDSNGLKSLVAVWKHSTAITNIWLKRNPLGPGSVFDLHELITKTANLRTLDLDQTELGNEKLAWLFHSLASYLGAQLPLRNLYINAVGVGEDSCKGIASFLSSPVCALESLYMSNNPLGDKGAMELSKGLQSNKGLLRLSIASCGLKSKGAGAIFDGLAAHPRLLTLSIGQSYSTKDLGSRYNFLTDDTTPSLTRLILGCKTLRMLDLGVLAMSSSFIDAVVETVTHSDSLVDVKLDSVYGKVHSDTRNLLRSHLEDNIRRNYKHMTYEDFQDGERRWLISPKDVRLIDSSYRNRDAGLARRGLMRLKKEWDDDDWEPFSRDIMEADYGAIVQREVERVGDGAGK